MTDAELHSRAAKLEKLINNFRIINPDGAVKWGFGKLHAGASDIEERVSNIERSVEKFTLGGDATVKVAGSFASGFAINAKPGVADSGTGTGTMTTFGCTDPEANNFDPSATEDDGSCTYDPLTGACCYISDGSCFDDLSEADCTDNCSGGCEGGVYQGDSSTCDAVTCDYPCRDVPTSVSWTWNYSQDIQCVPAPGGEVSDHTFAGTVSETISPITDWFPGSWNGTFIYEADPYGCIEIVIGGNPFWISKDGDPESSCGIDFHGDIYFAVLRDVRTGLWYFRVVYGGGGGGHLPYWFLSILSAATTCYCAVDGEPDGDFCTGPVTDTDWIPFDGVTITWSDCGFDLSASLS